jgi:hypothetical protein
MTKLTPRALMAGALMASACSPAADPARVVPATVTAAELRTDVAWLSDNAREGRGTGTRGFDAAASFVARRWETLGIARAPGMNGYLQPFTARAIRARGEMPTSLPTHNVVAMIPGSDPALAGQYVIIGAHLDHLGRSSTSALDPAVGDAIRNGADDNASGSVAVLELGRRLKQRPTRRSIILVHFSGEELGLLGSEYFANTSPVPLASVQAMVNFDMVGRLKNDRLIVYGTGTAAEMAALVDSVGAGSGLAINKVPDGVGPSDHATFYTKDIPVLHFFTDVHDDYHRASDDVERINAEGMLRVVNVAEKAIRALADRPAKLAIVRTAITARAGGSRQSSGVYFGSVPDMGAGDVPGMKLAGVTPGGPAAKAGLKAGDVIVEFGGKTVKDIYEYTDALNSFKPDDVVQVVVVRDGQRVTLTVTLGRRGG